MRLAVVAGVPAVLILAGSVYFLAKPKEDDRLAAILARAEQSPAAPKDPADAVDTELVRKLLQTRDLTESQTTALIAAAGRRYMRRKQAYSEAEQAVAAGRSAMSTMEPLRKDMDGARKVCDVAESLGRRSSELTIMASVDANLERMLAYGGSISGLGLTDRYSGINAFSDADLKQLEKEFEKAFGRSLPVSAKGDSAAHRALGFDHRGRVDVALNPLQPEGVWLRRYLSGKGITFFAFSSAVRGKATGAHIHIGGASARLGHGD